MKALIKKFLVVGCFPLLICFDVRAQGSGNSRQDQFKYLGSFKCPGRGNFHIVVTDQYCSFSSEKSDSGKKCGVVACAQGKFNASNSQTDKNKQLAERVVPMEDAKKCSEDASDNAKNCLNQFMHLNSKHTSQRGINIDAKDFNFGDGPSDNSQSGSGNTTSAI